MHEAQTPNDGAYIKKLNSVDSSQSSQGTTNPFDSILVGDNIDRELLLLVPASKEAPPNQTVNSTEEDEIPENIHKVVEVIHSRLKELPPLDEETNSDCDTRDDWVAEPNAQQQAMVNAEFQKLLELNQELRSANSKLYEQVEELTTALSESEGALQQHKKRLNVAESMLKQQTSESTAAAAQIQSLFEQLDAAVQNTQRQESLAQSYKEHLELSQQRLAQLERECALIQTKYTEQTGLLSQSENTCRELRTRLKRQQRQTLQFKAALEKSLETSIPGSDTVDDRDTPEPSSFINRSLPHITTNLRLGKLSQTRSISSIQPIKPWSASEDSHIGQNHLREENLTTSAANDSENPIQEEFSTWEFSANSDIPPIKDTRNTQTDNSVNDDLVNDDSVNDDLVNNDSVNNDLVNDDSVNNDSVNDDLVNDDSVNDDSVNNDSVNDDSVNEEATVEQVVSPSDSSELEEKLDSVIETFFASQTEPPLQQSPQEQDIEISETIIPSWKTVIEPGGTNNNDDNNDDDNNDDLINLETDKNSNGEEEQTVSFTSETNYDNSSETGDYWEEISDYPAFDLSQNAASFEIINDTEDRTNSPSPLIYPKRPPKGRKSLASVELPKFPQNSDRDNG